MTRHRFANDDLYTTFSDCPLFAQPLTPTRSPQQSSRDRQAYELARVSGKTSEIIQAFFDCHQVGETFHAGDLHKFVSARAPVAPASADRVMRAMRRTGQVNYEVVDRSQSLYRKCLPCSN